MSKTTIEILGVEFSGNRRHDLTIGNDAATFLFPAGDVYRVIAAIQEVCGITPAPDTERDKLMVSLSDRIDGMGQVVVDNRMTVISDLVRMDKRVDALDASLTRVCGEIEDRFSQTSKRITEIERVQKIEDKHLNDYVNKSHQTLLNNCDRLGERCEALEESLDDLIKAFDVHVGLVGGAPEDDRLLQLDSRVDTIARSHHQRINGVEEKLDALMDAVSEDVDEQLDRVEAKLDYIGDDMLTGYRARFLENVQS